MKITNKQLKQIIKEELEAVVSEGLGSDEGTFVAAYRAYLMGQGEEDVNIATKAAEAELEKLLSSPLEWAINLIAGENQKAYQAIAQPSTKKQYRPWPAGPSPMERSPHKSAQEE